MWKPKVVKMLSKEIGATVPVCDKLAAAPAPGWCLENKLFSCTSVYTLNVAKVKSQRSFEEKKNG